MSGFQILNTPPRVRNARKAVREPTEAIMAPFSMKSIVDFENVPLTKTARRQLIVRNICELPLHVRVIRLLDEAVVRMDVEWLQATVPPNSCVSMELVWTPDKVVSYRGTMRLADQRDNSTKDIYFVMTSVDRSKKPTASAPAGSLRPAAAATVQLRQAKVRTSPPKRMKVGSSTAKAAAALTKSLPAAQLRLNVRHDVLVEHNQLQVEPPVRRQPVEGKENVKTSTTPVANIFTDLLAKLKFTPAQGNPSTAARDDDITPTGPAKVPLWALPTPTVDPQPYEPPAAVATALRKDDTNVFSPTACSTVRRSVSPHDSEALRRQLFSHAAAGREQPARTPSPGLLCPPDKKFEFKMSPKTPTVNAGTNVVDPSSLPTPGGLSPARKSPAHGARTYLSPRRSGGGAGNAVLSPISPATAHRVGLSMIHEETPAAAAAPASDSTAGSISNLSASHYELAPNQQTYNVASALASGASSPSSSQYTSAQNLTSGTPLSKNFTSMQCLHRQPQPSAQLWHAQGSMPNLHDMQQVRPIESNRYFYQAGEEKQQPTAQESEMQGGSASNIDRAYDHQQRQPQQRPHAMYAHTAANSVHDINFRETEIAAQSSRLNLAHSFAPDSTTTTASMSRATSAAAISATTYVVNPAPSRTFAVPAQRAAAATAPPLAKPTTFGAAARQRRPSANAPRTPSRAAADDTKRSRDETSDRSMRQSYKYSPPKRPRQQLYDHGGSSHGSSLNSSSMSTMSKSTSSLAKGETFRVTSWGVTRPKQRTLSSTSRSVASLTNLLRQRPEDVVVPLFDADLHISENLNPDPFAATTTIDPFMAASMYVDDHEMDRHEIEFKKWLNALVTIPDDMKPDSATAVDFGALFHNVRHRELSVAQTKEVVSANHFTKYRLEGLRRNAIALYMSDEVRGPLARLVVRINRGDIAIVDRDLHVDIVLQRQLLELLLAFNPLWLRIGLEITFGEQIQMRHNGDVQTLSAFVVRRLCRDRQLEENTPPLKRRTEEYTLEQRRFTLKKMLTLLFFLDTAKRQRIVKHNPCMFRLESEYKDMRSVLLRFSSSFIANLGDCQKELRRVGIVLSHQQTYLDEFDYAFRNVAVDLRDGVRLNRVMEILLMRDDLMDKLRVPAISRLQRVHNVEVAFRAWREAKFKLSGIITAHEIADGNREKTFSLLWQLIHKFRSPKFNASAFTIQCWWRRCLPFVRERAQLRLEQEQRRERAAIVLQSAWRGQRDRRAVRTFAARRLAATIVLQSYVRRWLVQRQLHVQMEAAVLVQRWFRGTLLMRELRAEFQRLRAGTVLVQRAWRRRRFARQLEQIADLVRNVRAEAKRQHFAAVAIQQRFRAWRLMREQRSAFVRLREAVVRVQIKRRATMEMRTERQRYQELRSAAIVVQLRFRAQRIARGLRTDMARAQQAARSIQRFWRSWKLMLQQRAEFVQTVASVRVVQQRFRAQMAMRVQRKAFHRLRHSILVVQRQFRAQLAMRQQRATFQELRTAALSVQNRWRAMLSMRVQREAFQRLRSSAIVVQQRFRARQQMQQVRDTFRRMRQAAVIVQTRFRAQMAMKTQRQEFQKLRSAAVTIQRRFRANQACKMQRKLYQTQRSAAIRIQQHFRAYIAQRTQRSRFVQLRKSCQNVQARFRAMREMRQQRIAFAAIKSASIIVQRRFRANRACRRERCAFEALRKSTVCVQQRFRAKLEGRHQRAEFLRLRAACCTVQARFRAQLAMREARQEFLRLRTAAVQVQNRFRAMVAARKQLQIFRREKTAAICVQRHFRALVAMRAQRADFQRQREACLSLQSRWRAQRDMRQQRATFKQLRTCAINVQRRFRANRLARTQLEAYRRQKTAAICIQRRLRATLSMRTQRNAYRRLREAVISVQQRRRATLQMRVERQRYLHERTQRAAICVQRRFRALRLMRQDSTSYATQRTAAIRLQRAYRARRAMLQARNTFRKLREAAIVVQRRWRARLLAVHTQNEFLEYKLAVMKVQRRFRAKQLGREQRASFVRLRAATVLVQHRFRALLAMRKCRAEFLQQRAAIVCVQMRWRATLAQRCQRTTYQRTLTLIVWMQRRWRSKTAMRRQRCAFERLRSATVCVQQRWRGLLLMRQLRQQFLLIRVLVVCVQMKFRAMRAMRTQREEFVRLRSATVVVQKHFRAMQAMRRERTTFVRLQRLAIGLQAAVRGYAARRRFEAERPELMERRRRDQAVRLCQRVWRGYVVRRRTSRAVAEVRNKLRECTERAEPQQQLGWWVKKAVRLLNGRTNQMEVLRTLYRLVKVSRETPQVLIADARVICLFCYGIMEQAIRSEVDKQKIELCSCVILNLSRFQGTQNSALQNQGLVTVAQMLLRWCDKDCGIFNTLCSVIYVQVQCGRMRDIIYQYMTGPDAIFMLRETKKMVVRKERMRANRAPNPLQPPLTAAQRVELPMLQPDFGLRTQNSAAYVFNCSVFGFDTILHALGIRV